MPNSQIQDHHLMRVIVTEKLGSVVRAPAPANPIPTIELVNPKFSWSEVLMLAIKHFESG
jgi:hypothetical protein